VKRGDVYMVALDPALGLEQQGHRPVLIISANPFNDATKLPVVLPITNRGEIARRIGFGVFFAELKPDAKRAATNRVCWMLLQELGRRWMC
jgi:mRNA-degrading endonuclease toxin of MazEF toxin-antitoxin module